MKKKVRVRFDSLKRGDCFRLTLKGPIYMKDEYGCRNVILGKRLGRVYIPTCSSMTYPVKVNIVEEK